MTGAGGGLLAAGAVLVVLGSLLGYHELVLLGAVALATVAVAFAWVTRPVTLTTRQSLSRQQVERGETASLRMDIHNASARAVGTLLVTVRFFIDRGRVADAQMRGKRAGSALSRRRDIERTVDHIGGQSSATVWTQLPTDTRGIVRIAAFLSRSDPFGLLKWQKTFGVSSQMWVGPRTVRLTSMPAGVIADAEGINSDTAEEGSISFKAIGEYRRGDDIRRIHWPSVARTGKLMVRQYVDTGRPSFIVAVNIDESS